jgi:anti-anti-sigma factor
VHRAWARMSPGAVGKGWPMAGIPEHFSVDARREGEETVVALTGELDMAGTFVLEPRLDELVAAAPAGGIVFDLRGLRFIDSTGLATIVSAYQRLTDPGVPCRFLRGSADVQRIFAIAGFDDVLPFEDAPDADPGA